MRFQSMTPLPTSVRSTVSPKFCAPPEVILGIVFTSLTWTSGKRPGYFSKYFTGSEPVVVISELHARLLRLLAALVEFVSGLFPDIRRLAQVLRDPWADDVVQPDFL